MTPPRSPSCLHNKRIQGVQLDTSPCTWLSAWQMNVKNGCSTVRCMQGRVQEILLTTSLDTKELRQLVQNVLKRLV